MNVMICRFRRKFIENLWITPECQGVNQQIFKRVDFVREQVIHGWALALILKWAVASPSVGNLYESFSLNTFSLSMTRGQHQ